MATDRDPFPSPSPAPAGRAETLVSPSSRRFWKRFFARAFNPYRPELHYMRGPGPAWRAKHGMRADPAEAAISEPPFPPDFADRFLNDPDCLRAGLIARNHGRLFRRAPLRWRRHFSP